MFDPVLLAALSGTTFSPRTLFAGGEQGAWYDPSDFSTMFQDAAGTIPVTAVEQPVGLIRDKSGRGNHASQATFPSRPVLSARVNLLTYSEQFDNAAWTNSTVTVAANNVTAPDGTLTADRLTATGADSYLRQGINVTSGVNYTLSVYLRADAPTTISIYCLNPVTAQVCNVTTSWQQFSLVVAPSITGSVNWQIGGGSSFSTGEIIYAWGADLRVTNDGVGIPAYQRINAATDYDTSGFPLYLAFDGTDDSLATASVDFSAISRMTIFTGVRPIVGSNNLIVSLSTNPDVNPGVFAVSCTATDVNTQLNQFPDRKVYGVTVSIPSTNVTTVDQGFTSGGYINIRNNGTTPTVTKTIDNTPSATAYGNYAMYIGNRGDGTLRYNGRLYSLIVRGSATNADQIARTEAWVNNITKAY
jgi:hypothetical protein